MIVYFSGTGNSQYCAQMLSRLLGDECIDSFHYIREGIAAELSSDRPWIFVAPTYAWQLPRVFSRFLRAGRFSGSRDAYFVMTCGSDIGDATTRNGVLCSELGLTHRGTVPVVMPENYIALFDAPSPSESKQIIADARPVLEQIAAAVRSGRDYFIQKPSPLDKLKSGPINDGFYKYYISDKKFTATDRCVGCGRCEVLCPLGNIRLREGKPVWGGRCTHCMACICYCPTQAIEYGTISHGKLRYQGPICP